MPYVRNIVKSSDPFIRPDDLIVGDDIALEFEVFQNDLTVDSDGVYVSGTPEDVTTWTFRWELRINDTATGVPILSKTLGSGITVTGTYNPIHASNSQRVMVSIPDTETYSDLGEVLIPPQTYYYSLKRDDAGSEKTLVYGKFVLQEKPARL